MLMSRELKADYMFITIIAVCIRSNRILLTLLLISGLLNSRFDIITEIIRTVILFIDITIIIVVDFMIVEVIIVCLLSLVML